MLDSHTDTPMIFPGEFNIGLKEGGKVNLPFMEEGLIDATIMVAYIPQGPRDDASLLKATDFAMNRLQEIHRQMELNRTRMCIAYTPQEVHVLKAAGKKAIMLGVENGYAIGKDIENITRFRKWEFPISLSATTGATTYATQQEETRNGTASVLSGKKSSAK